MTRDDTRQRRRREQMSVAEESMSQKKAIGKKQTILEKRPSKNVQYKKPDEKSNTKLIIQDILHVCDRAFLGKLLTDRHNFSIKNNKKSKYWNTTDMSWKERQQIEILANTT